jgi:hypothetical protein
VVNSPIDVTVNGKSAEVLGAVGYPGAVDGYYVNFRVPAGIAKGSATIQVSAAWISGAPDQSGKVNRGVLIGDQLGYRPEHAIDSGTTAKPKFDPTDRQR